MAVWRYLLWNLVKKQGIWSERHFIWRSLQQVQNRPSITTALGVMQHGWGHLSNSKPKAEQLTFSSLFLLKQKTRRLILMNKNGIKYRHLTFDPLLGNLCSNTLKHSTMRVTRSKYFQILVRLTTLRHFRIIQLLLSYQMFQNMVKRSLL